MSVTTIRRVSMRVHPALLAYADWLDANGCEFDGDQYEFWRTAFEAGAHTADAQIGVREAAGEIRRRAGFTGEPEGVGG